jgi:hypothetical protein
MQESPATGGAQGIERVFRGMHVVDSQGRDLGKVESVRMADPEAADSWPPMHYAESPSNIGEQNADADYRGLPPAERAKDRLEPDVPVGIGRMLVRDGYVKVVRHHLLHHSEVRYISAGQIAGIEGETVTLTVAEGEVVQSE